MLVSVRLASIITGVKVPERIRADLERDKIIDLAENRRHCMAVPPAVRKGFRFLLNDWIFRIRSRNGFGVKARLVLKFIRKVIIPMLIPKRLHHLFIGKSIKPDYLSEA